MQRSDPQHRLRAVAFDDPLAPQLLAPLPQEQWRNTVHLILPDGRRYSGDRALPHLARLLPGGVVLSWVLRVPLIGPMAAQLCYRWLASQHS